MLDRFRLPMAAIVDVVARAIAEFEGFYAPNAGTLAQRNRNPGNLRSWAGFKKEKGFVKFPSLAEGWRSLRLQLWKDLVGRKLTLRELLLKYAPASDDNHPINYANFVHRRMIQHGIPLDSIDDVVYNVSNEFSILGPAANMKYPGHPNEPTPEELYGD